MSTTKTFIQTMNNLKKKIKTLHYVNQAIEFDMNKISKKSKEYEPMFQRSNNLRIAVVKTQMKQWQVLLNELYSMKDQKVSS